MPLDEGPRIPPVLYFSVSPVRPDHRDPVYFLSYRAQLGKRDVRLVRDMLYEGFLPSGHELLISKMRTVLSSFGSVAIDDFDDLHDQVGVPPGAEGVFFDMTIRSGDHVAFQSGE